MFFLLTDIESAEWIIVHLANTLPLLLRLGAPCNENHLLPKDRRTRGLPRPRRHRTRDRRRPVHDSACVLAHAAQLVQPGLHRAVRRYAVLELCSPAGARRVVRVLGDGVARRGVGRCG